MARRAPSPRARSSTSAGPPRPWYSVNGARRNAVTLSLATRRESLWLAVPSRSTSRVSIRSGRRRERFAAMSAPAKLALNTVASAA